MSRKKVIDTIKEVAGNYHYAPVDGNLRGKNFPNNLVFLALSYLLDRNHLLLGDPGTGKSTVAAVIASKFSGLPFDVFETLQMRGSPEVFEEKLIARPDYSKLTGGKEEVIWQGSFGLDALIIDEINRVPPGTQAAILEGIRTGRWTYLNDVLFEGKKPTFLTMNNRDDGNGEVIPPLEDRIDMVTEERVVNPAFDYLGAKEKIFRHLARPEITTSALDALKRRDYAGFKDVLHKSRSGDYLTKEEKERIQEEIKKLPWDNEAYYFLWAFAAEINHSELYGIKRSVDPISSSTHDKNFIGVNVRRSLSARPIMAAQEYASALAWLLGEKRVLLDHVRYVLPFVSAHKLEFTADYRNKHGNDNRKDHEDLHLAKCVVQDVEQNYLKSVQPLKALISEIQKGKLTAERIEEIKKASFDHPLLKILKEDFQQPKINLS